MGSRWPDAVPLKSIMTIAVLDALVEIFTRNGIPKVLLSDQGSQFTSKVMGELCKCFGIDKIVATTYFPRSNGVVERLHGILVSLIKKTMASELDWPTQIPLALYAIRLVPSGSTGSSWFMDVVLTIHLLTCCMEDGPGKN